MKKWLKNTKGLTLVELLAVIVILGVVAAIAVPSISGTIANSKVKADIGTYNMIVDAAIRASLDAQVNGDDGAIAKGTIATKLAGYLSTIPGAFQSDSDEAFKEVAVTMSGTTPTVLVYGGTAGDKLITVSGNTITVAT